MAADSDSFEKVLAFYVQNRTTTVVATSVTAPINQADKIQPQILAALLKNHENITFCATRDIFPRDFFNNLIINLSLNKNTSYRKYLRCIFVFSQILCNLIFIYTYPQQYKYSSTSSGVKPLLSSSSTSSDE